MNYKKLMKTYLWLLFCSVALMILCAYVYIIHFYNFIMVLGFILSVSSTAELIQLIITTYKDNKRKT